MSLTHNPILFWAPSIPAVPGHNRAYLPYCWTSLTPASSSTASEGAVGSSAGTRCSSIEPGAFPLGSFKLLLAFPHNFGGPHSRRSGSKPVGTLVGVVAVQTAAWANISQTRRNALRGMNERFLCSTQHTPSLQSATYQRAASSSKVQRGLLLGYSRVSCCRRV